MSQLYPRALLVVLWGFVFWTPLHAAVITYETAAPIHEVGQPRPSGFGPGARALDLDRDGVDDLVVYERTVCTDDIPRSSCVSRIHLRGINGAFAAFAEGHVIEEGARVGAKISNPDGTQFGMYGIFASPSVSILSRRLIPPVSSTPVNPFGTGVHDAYVAFQLRGADATSRYGYLHLDYNSWPEPHTGIPFQAPSPVLRGWAYESTPDTAIEVGPIPEPTTASLALLASFAWLWQRFRVRTLALNQCIFQ